VVIRWLLPLVLALAAVMALPASAADVSVTASPSIQFTPSDVTIEMNDTVTWNNGGGTHNVVFDDGSFTEPPAPNADEWSVPRTFGQPGIFRYQCGLHGASMRGVVRVRDATGTVPEPVEVPPGLSVSAADEQGLERLLGRGLRTRARCVNGCDIGLRLSLAPKIAKRLGFAERRVTIGRESDTLPVDRRVTIDIGLKPSAQEKVADAKRAFKVRLDVRATKDTAETARRTIKITL
jgi:plastocyanin